MMREPKWNAMDWWSLGMACVAVLVVLLVR